MDVAAGGPADAGGMQLGDVILALGAQAIEDSHDVANALAATPPGSTASVRILRGGRPQELRVTVGERPSDDD
jgi:serine protease Do